MISAKSASMSSIRSRGSSKPTLICKIKSSPGQLVADRWALTDIGATRLRVPPHDAPIAKVLRTSSDKGTWLPIPGLKGIPKTADAPVKSRCQIG